MIPDFRKTALRQEILPDKLRGVVGLFGDEFQGLSGLTAPAVIQVGFGTPGEYFLFHQGRAFIKSLQRKQGSRIPDSGTAFGLHIGTQFEILLVQPIQERNFETGNLLGNRVPDNILPAEEFLEGTAGENGFLEGNEAEVRK